MADFAESGEIVSRCIGYAENEFVEAYFENMIQNEDVIESSIAAKILLQFLEDMDSWEGTASYIYQILTPISNGLVFLITSYGQPPQTRRQGNSMNCRPR